ncbi:MAG: radical SAM protein [Sphingopyxis sp.]
MMNIFADNSVAPIAGFRAPTPAELPCTSGEHSLPLYLLSEHIPKDNAPMGNAFAASGCTIRCTTGQPYLQCRLYFDRAEGSLEVYHGDRLIDRADLFRGWQHSAVDVSGAPPDEPLTLRFCDHAGGEVSGILIESLSLSDTWGRGQRRRLKCHFPFSFTAVLADGAMRPCPCPTWLKPDTYPGNTTDATIAEMWNGPMYRSMRAQFLAGDYETRCRSDICPVLRGEPQVADLAPEVIEAINEGRTTLDFGPTALQHDIDYGCNLECTMCREAKILPNKGTIDRAVGEIMQVAAMGSLKKTSMSGAGEVLVMAQILKLLESDFYTSRNIEVSMTSNLTNFDEKMWDRIKHNRFEYLTFSADGASAAIYEAVRVGAKWEVVERNMRFLAMLRHRGDFKWITWNYTVQKANIADVAKAIELARELEVDWIRLIGHVGTLSRTGGNMFEDNDVAALDALYELMELANAFDDPRVMRDELGLDNRCYRLIERRIEIAEQVFDRIGAHITGHRLEMHGDWHKAVKLMEGVFADIEGGTLLHPDAFLPRHRLFVERFAAAARSITRDKKSVLSRLRHPRNLLRASVGSELARKATALLAA